jgi:hypothetical protein
MKATKKKNLSTFEELQIGEKFIILTEAGRGLNGFCFGANLYIKTNEEYYTEVHRGTVKRIENKKEHQIVKVYL